MPYSTLDDDHWLIDVIGVIGELPDIAFSCRS